MSFLPGPTRRPSRASAFATLALCAGLGGTAQAQPDIRPGERLSDWLLRQPAAGYPAGLLWLVPEERPAQRQLKTRLLARLTDHADPGYLHIDPASRGRLAAWLQALPVTGRVALAIPDARWLQAHPAQDPVLRAGQQAQLPPRPSSITLLLDDGRLCRVPHVAGADARSYLQACLGARAERSDTAWVAQPDGRSSRYGVAAWNEEPQDEPAPGAWLWAPTRDSGFDDEFSGQLIRFLASQGPAPDAPLRPGPALPAQAPLQPAEAAAARHRLEVSADDWGGIGLLQTPTARMAEAGDIRLHLSGVAPYTRVNLMLQPLDWLEAGFRYTDIGNQLYGTPELSGSQSYKDKSIDLKLRLAEESAYRPQLALGLRDIGGTGLFSGEYLVASKRSGDFDWSLGLGWGYLGARGDLANPLGWLNPNLRQRPATDSAFGGTVSNAMFQGPTALFGGVQWRTPWPRTLLKLEYDGNNYQHEPQDNNQTQASPFNFGLIYRHAPGLDLSLGLERGNTLMFGLTLHSNFQQLQTPKLGDASPPAFRAAMPAAGPASWERSAADIEQLTGWTVRRIVQHGDTLRISLDDVSAAYLQDRLERLTAVLHRDAPAGVQRFLVEFAERGLALQARQIDRAAWIRQHSEGQAPALRQPSQRALTPLSTPLPPAGQAAATSRADASATPPWANQAAPFKIGLGPSYAQILGGPDAFVLYQLGVQAKAEYRFSDSTWLSGHTNLRLLDNYSLFRNSGRSELPRVRTHAREYVTTSRLTLPQFQLTHTGQLSDNQFVSVYGGLLESMFAGVGAEWLYRPPRSPVALGVDLNHVRQRGFEQDFGLRDYSVNTGHLTLYWDTGWHSLQAKLSAGQYLAGDRGVTLDVSRRFDNGVAIGAYATKTNVSAEQFGEGSFDKGIYVNIPFDVILPRSSSDTANFLWSPLTRDGGARLNRAHTLFELTSARDRRAFRYRPPAERQTRTGEPWFDVPADASGQTSGATLLRDFAASGRSLRQQLTDPASTTAWLAAAGAIAGATLLDNSADRWARDHQDGGWNQLGQLANGLPLLLGAGVGALGLAGDEETAHTAWTALKAAGFTLAGNSVLRFAVGRARPEQELGNAHFNSFSGDALQSGFPSNHVGAAFALLTPFAQRYDMPWLYGLAAVTAVGRVQQREHWFSDTVAGGIMGYAVGSLLYDQQRDRQGFPQLSLGPRGVAATWKF